MEETVNQLKRLHAIEDVEQAVFSLERGMPAHPRVVGTMRMLLKVLIDDYNNEFAMQQEQESAPNPE